MHSSTVWNRISSDIVGYNRVLTHRCIGDGSEGSLALPWDVADGVVRRGEVVALGAGYVAVCSGAVGTSNGGLG